MRESDDDLPPAPEFCVRCWAYTDHFVCWDAGSLDEIDIGPIIALHDAVLRVEGEAA